MANTTNFNWETPDDTDLVKDGAAAIRTLGNSIDTSFVDLKGGTTGQILSKASNTDLDYTWIANDQGDITEVQAGTGISVASGTGPIPVVTNTVATAYDAKGDLIVGTGADTFSRLAVGGTNGHTLQVDSSTSTGLKWAAAAAPTFSGCLATKAPGGSQTIANNTLTIVTWTVEAFDTNTYHDNSTNTGRMTVPYAGYYELSFQIVYAANASGYRDIRITKNGTSILRTLYNVEPTVFTGSIINLGAASDYYQIEVYQNSGGNLNITNDYTYDSHFSINYLGA